MRIAALAAALLVLGGCARATPPAPAPSEVEADEVRAHRLTDQHPMRDIFARAGIDRIPMRILVGTDGRVVDARVETNPRRGGHDYPPAVAARAVAEARRWSYRPFTRGDAPVAVTFVESIVLFPPEDRPSRHVAMPPIDPSFRIRLQRTACYGTCPRYRVEVAANGDVAFEGEAYVFAPGRHRTRIEPAAVRRLYDLADRADFFSLGSSYRARITDLPTYVVTIEAGGRRHSIEDYSGESVGMPSIVRELEDAIDSAAGTRRWIEGDETILPQLVAEHFDFRSYDGARMLAAAAAAGKAALVVRLVEVGAPLSAPAPPPPDSLAGPIAALPAAAGGGDTSIVDFLLARRPAWSRAELHEAIGAAAAAGSYEAFRLLAERGALAGITPRESTEFLLGAAQRGDSRLVAAILRLHPDVNRVGPEFPDGPILAQASKVTCPWNRRPPACDPAAVTALLLRAGANPRLTSPISPESPLNFVSDVRVARLLLAAGADPNFENYDGGPPIFSIYREEVGLALLDAGADPRARRPTDRMSVAQWARDRLWPRVLAWLQARGIRP